MTEPTLLLLTGPPGTGKSSLAEHAAGVLGASVLGWDWAMAAMTDNAGIQEALSAMTPTEHRQVGWSILWNLATAQLRADRSVILDGVARDNVAIGSRELAATTGARGLVVETVCTDPGVHRGRIEGRRRDIPGWHELDWQHVAGVVERWAPPERIDLRLDAVAPFADNTSALSALLGVAT